MGLIIFPIVLALFVTFPIISIGNKAPIASKSIFAIVAALIAHNQYSFGSGGIISYVIWLTIFAVGCLLLCLTPRINRSFVFLSNTLITHVASSLVIGIFCSIFLHDQKPTLFVELIVKGICLFASVAVLWEQGDAAKGSNMGAFVIIQRVIASAIYALAMFSLFGISLNNHYEISLVGAVFILGVSFVIAYIFDDVLLEGMSRKVGVQNVSYEVEEEDKSIWSRINARFEYKQDIEEYVSAKVFEKEQKEEEDRWHREWMEQDY